MDPSIALPNTLPAGFSNLLGALGVAISLAWLVRLLFMRASLQELQSIVATGRIIRLPRIGRFLMELSWYSRDHLKHFLGSSVPPARRPVDHVVLHHRMSLVTPSSVPIPAALTSLRV